METEGSEDVCGPAAWYTPQESKAKQNQTKQNREIVPNKVEGKGYQPWLTSDLHTCTSQLIDPHHTSMQTHTKVNLQ